MIYDQNTLLSSFLLDFTLNINYRSRIHYLDAYTHIKLS